MVDLSFKKWKIALIGFGMIGRIHAELIRRLPHAELVAVCDPNPASAGILREMGYDDVRLYPDLGQLLRRAESANVALICTPSGNHMEPAITALQFGLHVIIEKPLEIDPRRIDAIL